MSTQTSEPRIPTLTLGWRLKMALDFPVERVKAEEMRLYLGVSRQTLSRWMGDQGKPPARAYVLQWAARCGVDADWLEHGDGSPGSGSPVSDTAGYRQRHLFAA